ncbi:MAG: hypothetical protein DRN12_06305, partial [Thermoplasmata archaeon]
TLHSGCIPGSLPRLEAGSITSYDANSNSTDPHPWECVNASTSVDASYDWKTELQEIRNAIKESGASWTAGYTPVLEYPAEIQNEMLGANVPQDDFGHRLSNPLPTQSPPSEWDWRPYMTSVRDQGPCGSCVSFGTLAAFEGVVKIVDSGNGRNWDPDFSESQLFFCGGGSCSSGWNHGSALNFLLSNGVIDEEGYPYYETKEHEGGLYYQSCSQNAPDWMYRTLKIQDWNYITYGGCTPTERDLIKDALVTYGPLVTRFDVYEDFRYYTGGVYEHTGGSYIGGHCVCLVGYKDDSSYSSGGYWICKNSWGPGWGEEGYFRIAYGEVGIDDYVAYMVFNRPASQPDLKVHDITLNPDVDDLYPGDSVDIDVEIWNVGSIDAGSFGVDVYFDGELVGTYTVSSLVAHGSEIISLTINWPTDCDIHEIKAVVDIANAVAEASEVNNERWEYHHASLLFENFEEQWTSGSSPIFFEGFENGFPPTGWQVYNLGDDTTGVTWQQDDVAVHDVYSAACWWGEPTEFQNEWLVTGPITLPVGNVYLSFAHYASYASWDTIPNHVWISTSGPAVADFTGSNGALVGDYSYSNGTLPTTW